MPTLISRTILTVDDTGYAFPTFKQASGIAPTIMGVDTNRNSLRREGEVGPAVWAREAAAGGSDLTITLYCARSENRADVTLPDLSNASSFSWEYLGAIQGPFWNEDDQGFRDPDTSLFIYRVKAL